MQNFSVDQIGKLIDNQREYYFTGATRSVDFRKRQLVNLKQVIKKYEDEILKALNHDLGKPEFESYVTEVGFVLDSITFFIKYLKRWTRDKRVRTPIFQPFSRSFIRREPYGVTLIIAPFNYPFSWLWSHYLAL